MQRLLGYFNQPGISEESKAALHHLKLDLVSSFDFSWSAVHSNMLMHSSIVLDNMTRTIPQIDEDQKVALLHAPLRVPLFLEVNWQNYKKRTLSVLVLSQCSLLQQHPLLLMLRSRQELQL